jgi:hypothetical protein
VELFLHPRPVNNTFNVQKDCKYRFVYGHHGGAVILQPIDLQAERKSRQNGVPAGSPYCNRAEPRHSRMRGVIVGLPE